MDLIFFIAFFSLGFFCVEVLRYCVSLAEGVFDVGGLEGVYCFSGYFGGRQVYFLFIVLFMIFLKF